MTQLPGGRRGQWARCRAETGAKPGLAVIGLAVIEVRMSEEPLCAQKGPYQVELVEGKAYFWCTCGRSAKQPFCDGSHKVTSLQPLRFVASASGTVNLCGCKGTDDRPYCDGTHNML